MIILDENQKQVLNKYIVHVNDTESLKIYLESIMPFVPYYLYWAYFIFSFLSFLYLFSIFYKFGHKFYTNFRDEGVFSFKANDTWY